MVIIGQKQFPLDKSTELAAAFLEISDLPDYISSTGPFLRTTRENGAQSIAVFEFPADRMDEAYRLLNQRYIRYINIPGYSYELNVWMETKDTMQAISLG